MKEVEVAATNKVEANKAEAQICNQQEAKLKGRVDILNKKNKHLKYELVSYIKLQKDAYIRKNRNCKILKTASGNL